MSVKILNIITSEIIMVFPLVIVSRNELIDASNCLSRSIDQLNVRPEKDFARGATRVALGRKSVRLPRAQDGLKMQAD